MTTKVLGEMCAIIGIAKSGTKEGVKSPEQLKGYWQKRQKNEVRQAVLSAEMKIYTEMLETGFADEEIEEILNN